MPFRLITCWRDTSRSVELLPGENLLGSESGCDVLLPHPGVSRHHAVLLVLEDAVEVADLGSQNGTFVDGRRLTDKATVGGEAALAFGPVEARLERLQDDDAEAALTPSFEPGCDRLEDAAAEGAAPPRPPGRDDGAPMPATTASVGPLQLFALVQLPKLVGTLADLTLAHPPSGAAEPAARATGEALSGSLPCTRVTISRRRGILFRHDESAAPPEAGEAGIAARRESATAGDLQIEVEFDSASAARLYRPILETLARLLAISLGQAKTVATAATRPEYGAAGEAPPLPEPATRDATLRQVYNKAAQLANSDQNVLILGDSGTGKELLAQYVHRASPRREEPFVAVNCAALPEDLLEAELFGIEEGVATGVDARPGRFEQAHGGTLFLDEIGDMSPAVQAKILRVLQEKEVHRLGGLAVRAADVRVVSATHQDLGALRATGRFRDDLYHRIADWRLRLPRLSERAVDIPNLASYFLAREARRRGIESRGISRAALRVLSRHSWPGNVRQLEKEVAKAALFVADGGLLDTRCLDAELLDASPPESTLREHLERVEAQEIRRALEATGHDVPTAAADLGLPESTLYRKIRNLGLDARIGDVAEASVSQRSS